MGYERPIEPKKEIFEEIDLGTLGSPRIPNTPMLPVLPTPPGSLRSRRGYTEPVYSNVWFGSFRYNPI